MIKRLILFLSVSSVAFAQKSAVSEASLLLELYTFDPVTWKSHYVARLSVIEPLGSRRPTGSFWYVKPAPSMTSPLDSDAVSSMANWVQEQNVPGLVLDGHTEVSDQEIRSLKPLSSLFFLSLRETRVTDAGLKSLSRLMNLHHLDLSGTQVAGDNWKSLKDLKNLERIGLWKSPAYTKGLQALSGFVQHQVQELPEKGLSLPAPAPRKVAALDAQEVYDLGDHPLGTGLDYTVKNPARAQEASRAEKASLQSAFLGPDPSLGIPGHLKRGKFPADYSLRLKTLDGRTVLLSDMKQKVIFMNFWSTWCGPCRSELPSLENLYQTLKDQDVFFAFVAPQPAAAVSQYLFDHPVHMPVYVVDGATAGPYISAGVPSTFIISKKGDFVVRRLGAAKWDTQEVMQYIFDLMAEPSPTQRK